ncbi:MAG TPA: FxLYD domain-containing protein [Methylomirabilota bacterium]|nr:FxLYD domain-containing protein [Methylomirabilota bacterium]
MRGLRAMIAGAGASLLLLAASPVCTSAAPPLSPLVVDWESYFRLDWQTAQARGRTVVRGTIQNTSTYRARRIQLLIEGVDTSGAIVNQRVEWLGSDLMPGDHLFFESPVGGPAASYRVSVFAFDAIRPT